MSRGPVVPGNDVTKPPVSTHSSYDSLSYLLIYPQQSFCALVLGFTFFI